MNDYKMMEPDGPIPTFIGKEVKPQLSAYEPCQQTLCHLSITNVLST